MVNRTESRNAINFIRNLVEESRQYDITNDTSSMQDSMQIAAEERYGEHRRRVNVYLANSFKSNKQFERQTFEDGQEGVHSVPILYADGETAFIPLPYLELRRLEIGSLKNVQDLHELVDGQKLLERRVWENFGPRVAYYHPSDIFGEGEGLAIYDMEGVVLDYSEFPDGSVAIRKSHGKESKSHKRPVLVEDGPSAIKFELNPRDGLYLRGQVKGTVGISERIDECIQASKDNPERQQFFSVSD